MKNWFNHAARFAFVACAFTAGSAPAIADEPVQTDYDAEFYFLLDSGDIVIGSLAYGVGAPVVTTSLGSLATGLEFMADGTLLCTGGSQIGLSMVARVDPSDGSHEVILTQADASQDIPGIYILRGLATAPDNTFYVYVQIFEGSDLVFTLGHYDADGTFLDAVRIKNPDGSNAGWVSHAFAVRDDGMLFTSESLGGRYGVIDPATGTLTVMGTRDPGLEKWYGMAVVGSTAFASLGVHGEHVYRLDPDSGELSFLATIDGLVSGASGFGFAMAPDPCAADMTYDDAINIGDIETFVNAFLDGSTAADLDYSRATNFNDLDIFVGSYLAGCGD